MSDDLRDLKEFAALANEELRALLDQAARRLPEAGAGQLLEVVGDVTLRGGKRLRPGLAWFAALCIEDEAAVPGLLSACCSLELLQTYLLIHDDIMDGDDIRRGGPTAHRMLDDGDAEQGRMLAILAGDLAATLARLALERAELAPDRKVGAFAELNRMEWEVIHGQFLDMRGSPRVAVVHDLKTASYSTRGPVRMGGVLAGASDEQLAALEAYGTPLGLAFQLRDDLLDFQGDPAKTGKAVGIDLKEGRLSAVIEEALQCATPEDRAVIEGARGTNPDDEQLRRALDAVTRSGALQTIASRARQLTDDAIAALEGADLRDEGRVKLVRIAEALAARVH